MYLIKPLIITFLKIGLTLAETEEPKENEPLMKAIVIHSFGWSDVLQLEKVLKPKISQSQVLVQVKAIGISPVDTYIRAGTYYVKPAFPYILGKEVAGIIEESGACVPMFKRGDRVFCCIEAGGYAEYVAADVNDCYPLPTKLSFSQGASICMTYFAAHRALITKGHAQEGESILIHGASGALGVALVQVGKTVGAQLVATVGEFSVSQLMKRAGADYIIYHNKHYYLEDAIRSIRKTGFDIVLDILTTANLQQDKNYLNRNGRIIVFGKHVTVTITDKHLKESEGRIYRISITQYSPEQKQVAADFIMDGVKNDLISPVVGMEYKLEEAALAHNDVLSSKCAIGKLVFIL